MIIAAYMDGGGKVADFFEKGSLCLFGKVGDVWTKTKEVPLDLDPGMGLADLRARIGQAAAQVEGGHVFLARELRGVLRVFWEEAGFRVWKSSAGTLAEQLESARRQETAALRMEAAARAALPQPLPVGDPSDGRYRIDLAELLRRGSCHVSRDLLMPFFETVSFGRLEVCCDHVPKWFGMELPELDLTVESQALDASGNGMTVVVVPKDGPRSRPPGSRPGRFSCHCGDG